MIRHVFLLLTLHFSLLTLSAQNLEPASPIPEALRAFAQASSHIAPTPSAYPQIRRKFRPPGTVLLGDSLFVDQQETSNIDYRFFLWSLENRDLWTADADSVWKDYTREEWRTWMAPDTTVWDWDRDFALCEPLMLYFSHPAFNLHPVVGISYEQALLYCKWQSAEVTRYMRRQNNSSYDYIYTYRLPTYQEWTQIAFQTSLLAEAPDVHVETSEQIPRFWGESLFPDKQASNIDFPERAADKQFRDPKTRLFHMIGNVSEMVQEKGIAKGGSWKDEEQEVIYACYQHKSYSRPAIWLGFRCVCDVKVIPKSLQKN